LERREEREERRIQLQVLQISRERKRNNRVSQELVGWSTITIPLDAPFWPKKSLSRTSREEERITWICRQTMSGTNSFSHITTLSLPSSYTLLPKSINPRMDIIALTRALPVTFAPPRRMLPGGGGGGGGWTAREDRKEREINARGRVAVGVWRLEGGGGAVVDGYGSASVAGQVGIGAGGGGGGGGGGNGSVWEVQLGGGEVVDVAWAPEGGCFSFSERRGHSAGQHADEKSNPLSFSSMAAWAN
jgi:hypothetical protein